MTPKSSKRLFVVTFLLLGIGFGSFVLHNRNLDRGESAFKGEEYAAALYYLRPLAILGDSTSQYLLGLMYAYGLGVASDQVTAVTWLKRSVGNNKAGDNQFASHALQIADSYWKGSGLATHSDVDQARYWLNISKQAGAIDPAKLSIIEREINTN